MNEVTVELTVKELYEVAKLLEVKVPSKAPKAMLVSLINKQITSMNEGYMQPLVNPLGDNSVESESVDADIVSGSRIATEVELASVNIFRGVHPITGEPV